MKRKSSKSSEAVHRWRVTKIAGNAARQITVLEANSADAAIKQAIKDFDITDPEQLRRIAAHRVA